MAISVTGFPNGVGDPFGLNAGGGDFAAPVEATFSGFDFGGPGNDGGGYGRGSYISGFDVMRGEWAEIQEANRAAAYRSDVMSGVRDGAGAGLMFGIPFAIASAVAGGIYASNTSSNRSDGAGNSRGGNRGGASVEGPDDGQGGESFPDPGVDESAPSAQSPQPARQREPAPTTTAPVTGITRVNDDPLNFGGALSDADAQAKADAEAAASAEALAAEEERRRNAIRRTINPTGPQGLLTRPKTSRPTLEGLLL